MRKKLLTSLFCMEGHWKFFHCNLSDSSTYPDFFSWVRWKFKIIMEIKSNQPSGSILSISWLFPKKEALALRWPLVTALSYTNYARQISLQMREIIYGQDQRVNRRRFDGVDPVVLYPFNIYYYCICIATLSTMDMVRRTTSSFDLLAFSSPLILLNLTFIHHVGRFNYV